MSLSEEQSFVVNSLFSKIKTEKVLKIGGFAGTGKSTIVKHITETLDDWAVCAYTGKAANILRKKGIEDASTIHSLIYVPKVDGSGNIVLDKNGTPIFILNPNLDCAGIIIDEASMVNQEIYEDLLSFSIPLIFVGDHGQLPPIGTDINLMAKPDFTLETIHRNAGEIAHFAEFIRKGYRPAAYAPRSKGAVTFMSKNTAEKHYQEVDQIICGFNQTRVEINRHVRTAKGKTNDWPTVGEKVMCLRNDKTHGVFNGMQGTVDLLYTNPKNKMSFRSNDKNYEVLFDPTQFNKEKYSFSGDRNDPIPFDFCEAITCHKAQGDEWENVMVIEQKCSLWDFRRWAYTAASRARNYLKWVS